MSFDTALAFTLKEEGGYSDNPSDHGGATMHGITQRTYDDYRANLGLPSAPVLGISDDDVSTIYRGEYWDAVRGDSLPEPLDIVCFDSAVNSGGPHAAKWLQRAVNVSIDGDIGPQTLAAVAQCDVTNTCAIVLNLREEFDREDAQNNPSQRKFLNDWLGRIGRLRDVVRQYRGNTDPASN